MHGDKPHLCSRFLYESRLLNLLEVGEEKNSYSLLLGRVVCKEQSVILFPCEYSEWQLVIAVLLCNFVMRISLVPGKMRHLVFIHWLSWANKHADIFICKTVWL